MGAEHVRGVALYLDSDLYGAEGALVVGQLTLDGKPVDGAKFVLGTKVELHYMDPETEGRFGALEGTAVSGHSKVPGFWVLTACFGLSGGSPVRKKANGAEITYFLERKGAVRFVIDHGDFGLVGSDLFDPTVSFLYTLPFMPVDPPGEGSVGFL